MKLPVTKNVIYTAQSFELVELSINSNKKISIYVDDELMFDSIIEGDYVDNIKLFKGQSISADSEDAEYSISSTPIIDMGVNEIISIYNNHRQNGVKYFDKIRAGIVFEYKSGVKTIQQVLEIENKLSEVKANVVSGDWITAKSKLASLSVEGAFTNELKQGIATDIDNYIQSYY